MRAAEGLAEGLVTGAGDGGEDVGGAEEAGGVEAGFGVVVWVPVDGF